MVKAVARPRLPASFDIYDVADLVRGGTNVPQIAKRLKVQESRVARAVEQLKSVYEAQQRRLRAEAKTLGNGDYKRIVVQAAESAGMMLKCLARI
jgi:transposase